MTAMTLLAPFLQLPHESHQSRQQGGVKSGALVQCIPRVSLPKKKELITRTVLLTKARLGESRQCKQGKISNISSLGLFAFWALGFDSVNLVVKCQLFEVLSRLCFVDIYPFLNMFWW